MSTFYASYSPTNAVDITGTITASNPSVAPTGGAVPADATYVGIDIGGTLTGLTAGQATMADSVPVAIASNQSTLPVTGSGSAGTSASGVVTVQGIASMTPVQVSQATAANLNATVVQGTAANLNATVVQGTAANLNATVVQGTAANLNATVLGSGSAGTAAAGVVTVQGIASMTPILVTQSGSGTQQSVNVSQFGGNNVVTGTGTGGNGIPRVTVSSDSSLASVTTVTTVTTVSAVTAITDTVTVSEATAAVTWQTEGSIAAGSLTTSFATAFTTGGALVWVGLRNNTNGSVVVSLDGGTTSAFTLDSGDQVSLDLKPQGKSIAASVAIQAKYTGSAPTTGNFRVDGYY